MTTASFHKYNQFVVDLGKKVHNLNADTLKLLLSNTAPNKAAHAVKADAAEISAGHGYSAGGAGLSNAYAGSGGGGTLTGSDITWTAAGGTIGPFRYAVLYNDTPTSPADPLIGWWDYGSAITLADGGTFTFDLGASLLTVR